MAELDGKTISQRELARLLDLSTATVSKSLNRHPDINAATQARVLEAASRFGYRLPAKESVRFRTAGPNSHRAPSTTRFVGVLIYDNSPIPEADVTAEGYLMGLSEWAKAHNAALVVHRFGGDSRQLLSESDQPAAMREGLLSGLVLIHRMDNQVVRELSTRFPCVTLTHYVPDCRADHVDSDHAGAMIQLVASLAAAGHRRIGFAGRSRDLSYTLTRFGSWCQAMARHGLPLVMDAVLNVFDRVEPQEQARRIQTQVRAGNVTAWVCDSDRVGYDLTEHLTRSGLRVPQDVSLTGFDAIAPRNGCLPLRTVRVPFVEMGVAALERLFERIERPTLPPRQTLLDCSLVEGSTVAPCKLSKGL